MATKNICVIFFENDEAKHTVFLPQGSTCGELRQKWQEASKDPGSDFVFIAGDIDGAEVPQEGVVDALVSSSRPVLFIYVHRAEEKRVRVLGAEWLEPLTFKLQPNETINGLKDRVKAAFGIEEKRVTRLLLDGRPLEEEGQASALLAGCVALDLDLQCQFAVYDLGPVDFHPLLEDTFGLLVNDDLATEVREEGVDPSDDPNAFPAFARSIELRRVLRFASEPGWSLAADSDGVCECRATASSSGASIFGGESLDALLSNPLHLLQAAPVGVLLERRMAVYVDDKIRRRRSTKEVWPSARLCDFMESTDDCVLLDGQLFHAQQSLWAAGVQEGCVITITQLATLSVFNEAGALSFVTADLSEPLMDLRQRLNVTSSHVDLWCDGEILRSDERSLLERGIDATSILYALYKCRDVLLTSTGAKDVRIGAVRKGTTFLSFLQTASVALKTQLPPETRFICECGRVFSLENVERRVFPLRCCPAPEARLALKTPHRTRNKASETVWRKKEVACQTPNTFVDAACQMKVRTRRRPTQTDTRRCRQTTQTETRRCRQTTQTETRRCRQTTQTEARRCCQTSQIATKACRLTTQIEDSTAAKHQHTPSRSSLLVGLDPAPAAATPARIAHFRIYWRVDNHENFDYDLPCGGAPLGRELRAAVAEIRGKPKEILELKQSKARRRKNGAAVALIGWPFYADENGQRVAESEVGGAVWHVIGDDDIVLTAGPLRAVIYVTKKWP